MQPQVDRPKGPRASEDPRPSVHDSSDDSPVSVDIEKDTTEWNWDTDAQNPYNWPLKRKLLQLIMISVAAFSASVGTSISSLSVNQMKSEFNISTTLAILPLSLYVLALGLGPIIGGPLSETIGRYPVYLLSAPLAGLFTVGVALTHSFAAHNILRFLAGFCFSPSLAISSGTINEVFRPADRAIPSIIFILMPFLGPGLGPVFGAFITTRKGWRWTQWTLALFAAASLLAALLARETYHPILRRRRAAQLHHPLPPLPSPSARLKLFAQTSLLRPLHMLVAEPIVSLICLYVSFAFATLFSFFAALPYVFRTLYSFPLEHQGLVFLSIAIGCLLGTLTLMLCNRLLYIPATARYPPHQTPPEHRLYPAMIGSLGMPLGLFWFGWSARTDISWLSPAAAIVPFAMGNLCLFVSTIQYIVDTYHGTTVASASSANSFARYALAAAFPLFTIPMYQKLGIGGASSLLGGIAVLLMPVPWAFFRYGERIRRLSKYTVPEETH